jgi:hypothetical protein
LCGYEFLPPDGPPFALGRRHWACFPCGRQAGSIRQIFSQTISQKPLHIIANDISKRATVRKVSTVFGDSSRAKLITVHDRTKSDTDAFTDCRDTKGK